jgi:hypothetical protein
MPTVWPARCRGARRPHVLADVLTKGGHCAAAGPVSRKSTVSDSPTRSQPPGSRVREGRVARDNAPHHDDAAASRWPQTRIRGHSRASSRILPPRGDHLCKVFPHRGCRPGSAATSGQCWMVKCGAAKRRIGNQASHHRTANGYHWGTAVRSTVSRGHTPRRALSLGRGSNQRPTERPRPKSPGAGLSSALCALRSLSHAGAAADAWLRLFHVKPSSTRSSSGTRSRGADGAQIPICRRPDHRCNACLVASWSGGAGM